MKILTKKTVCNVYPIKITINEKVGIRHCISLICSFVMGNLKCVCAIVRIR